MKSLLVITSNCIAVKNSHFRSPIYLKYFFSGVLIGMAFVESFIVYHSIVVTVDIIRKLKYKLCSGGNSSTDGERRGASNNGELPGISVEQYYSEIMMAVSSL